MSDDASLALIDAFQQAVEGLLVMSESDYPLTVRLWQGQEPLTVEMLLRWLNQPEDQPIAVTDVETFFRPLRQVQEWQSEPEQAIARQFQTLVRLIQERLTEVQVYRVGEIKIDVYIVGRATATDWIVLMTQVVET